MYVYVGMYVYMYVCMYVFIEINQCIWVEPKLNWA